MPANYANILQAINLFNGGVAANTGNAGQPIAFVNANNTLLRVASNSIFDQLIGAFVTSVPLHGNLVIVRISSIAIGAGVKLTGKLN